MTSREILDRLDVLRDSYYDVEDTQWVTVVLLTLDELIEEGNREGLCSTETSGSTWLHPTQVQ